MQTNAPHSLVLSWYLISFVDAETFRSISINSQIANPNDLHRKRLAKKRKSYFLNIENLEYYVGINTTLMKRKLLVYVFSLILKLNR